MIRLIKVKFIFYLFLSHVLGSTMVMGVARPNIILIESDDQSNLAVGAYGHGRMHTPVIDSLAREGVYFTRAYNMGCWSPAVCIPSRTMLFNAVHLWKASRITENNAPGPSLPERLKAAGYTTYFTGKWHALGKKPIATFDHVGQVLPGQLKTFWTDKGHLTDLVAEEAVEFIHQASGHAEPFFLYVAFNAPHVPRETFPSYYDLYPPQGIDLPPSVKDGPLHPQIKYNYSKDPLSKEEMRRRYQQNNAMVSHMDDRIGDILAALKKVGAWDNSLIVFTSDQGINFGENGVAGKVCLYEVSATAPLILSGPGIPADIRIATPVYLQDIYPTLLHSAGLEVPDYMDFQSLHPLIENPSLHGFYPSIYMAMFDDQRGIVVDGFKLILYPQTGAMELYNLAKDPWEMNNLAELPEFNSQLSACFRELRTWQKRTGDTLQLDKALDHGPSGTNGRSKLGK